MPIYEFECNECKHRFEICGSYTTSLSRLIVCPVCGKNNTRKVFSVPGVWFKGSGFYSTDNRREG